MDFGIRICVSDAGKEVPSLSNGYKKYICALYYIVYLNQKHG